MGDEFGKRLNIEARKLIKANKVKIKYFFKCLFCRTNNNLIIWLNLS